jgi:hypothetical protein
MNPPIPPIKTITATSTISLKFDIAGFETKAYP